MTRPEGWLHRGPRPLMMWVAVLTILLVVAFFVALGLIVLKGFDTAITAGRDVPDMSGGLPGILSGLAVLLPAAAAFFQVFNQRHVERRDQITRGPAPGPFVPPEPSPTGGLVNNQAIE